MSLTKYVVMPGADYQAACDAIRSKTGKTDLIKSGDMATEINSFQTQTVVSGYPHSTMKAFIERSIVEMSLPSDLTSVGSGAFEGCSALALTTLPSTVTSLGDNAFYGCTAMPLTSLPSGLTHIGNQVFYNCNKLAVTEIPASVNSIGSKAFYGCPFSTITFKGTPASIASDAFSGCNSVATINVPWSQGVVSGAPWGAMLGAGTTTVNYNYTG